MVEIPRLGGDGRSVPSVPKDLRGFTGFKNLDFVLHGSLLFSLHLVPKDLWGFTGFKDFDFVLHFNLQMKNCCRLTPFVPHTYSQRIAPSLLMIGSFLECPAG